MTAKEPVRLNVDVLTAKFGSCEYSPNRPNESVLHLSRGYSKAILNQPQGKQEIVVRTYVKFRNHLEAISAHFAACTDNTIAYSV